MQNKKNAFMLSVFAGSIIISGCTDRATAPENGTDADQPQATGTTPADDGNSAMDGNLEIDTSSRLEVKNGNPSTASSEDEIMGLPPGTVRKESDDEEMPPAEPDFGTAGPTGSEDDELEANAEAGTVYRNGTYTETGAYQTPGNTANIKVTVTITGDAITDVEVVPLATKEGSLKNQAKFAEGIDAVVVGKKLEEITELEAVNGSSLTGEGFLDALAKIKLNARPI